jgi:hypothetical protein
LLWSRCRGVPANIRKRALPLFALELWSRATSPTGCSGRELP